MLHVLLGFGGRGGTLAGRSREHSARPRFAPCPVAHNFYVKHVLVRIGPWSVDAKSFGPGLILKGGQFTGF